MEQRGSEPKALQPAHQTPRPVRRQTHSDTDTILRQHHSAAFGTQRLTLEQCLCASGRARKGVQGVGRCVTAGTHTRTKEPTLRPELLRATATSTFQRRLTSEDWKRQDQETVVAGETSPDNMVPPAHAQPAPASSRMH